MDNCKYNGTLTGSASTILNLINNYSNWIGSNSTPFDISASAFPTPNITDPLPVELTLFAASSAENKVILNWITETEVNNFGFEVERLSVISNQSSVISNNPLVPSGNSEIPNPQWVLVGFVEGNGNSNSPKEYSFVDNLSNLEILQSCNLQCNYEITFDAGKYNLSSGTYFYRINAGEFTSTKK